MPDPWKNQCKKRRAFRYYILRILVSIWRGLGLQNASQNHTLGTKMLGHSSFWAVLAAVFPQNGASESPEVDFGALMSRFGNLWGQLSWYFASFLSMLVSICCIIWTNFPYEFLAACVGLPVSISSVFIALLLLLLLQLLKSDGLNSMCLEFGVVFEHVS